MKKADEILSALRRSALFGALPPRDLACVARGARVRGLAKNEVVFCEGARADGFYVVASGRVKVYKVGPQGREQILHMVGPGGSFGEAAVFAGGTFPASARAAGRARVVYLDGAAFLDCIERTPGLALEIMASLSARLREFTSLIEALSLREVGARVAKFLLDESARAGRAAFELAMTKAALASQLGTAAETLSRAFASLARRRLVRVRGRRVEVLDARGLARAAAGLQPKA